MGVLPGFPGQVDGQIFPSGDLSPAPISIREARKLKPRAKAARFVVEELEDEVLVYDPDEDRAHCLNATASFIWRLADGNRDVGELARLLSETFGKPASEEIVLLALDRLQRAQLLEGDSCHLLPSWNETESGEAVGRNRPGKDTPATSPAWEEEAESASESEGETRRQALRRMARVGVTLPAVMTMALPSPLQAATQIPAAECWRDPRPNAGKCCTNGRECIQWGRVGLCIGRRC